MLPDHHLSTIFFSLLDEDALHRRSAASFLLACQGQLIPSYGQPNCPHLSLGGDNEDPFV
jgi:hypothetical protein